MTAAPELFWCAWVMSAESVEATGWECLVVSRWEPIKIHE